MDYSIERYVRVYTRDSTTWKLLDWRARCTLVLLLRKVNRVGLVDHDGHGPMGIAALLELPLEIVEAGLAQLLDPRFGILVEAGTAYLLPRFLDAQEAIQDDATRSREYRARKRDRAMAESAGAIEPDVGPTVTAGEPAQAVTPRDADITARDETVTPRPGPSHGVTPNRTDPILREEIPPKAEKPPVERKKPLPEDWSPSRNRLNYEAERVATARGVDLALELSKLRDWAKGENAKKTDWDAFWRNWTRNAKPLSGPNRYPSQANQPPREIKRL